MTSHLSAAALSCRQVFSEMNYAEAGAIVEQSLKTSFFNSISISEIKHLENFGPGHPERSHGFRSPEMLKGKFEGKTVLIKKADQFEIRMAKALSRLGVGPYFHGTTGNGDYYVVNFISDGILLKPSYIDHRYQQMKADGFEIKEKSFQQISMILKSLAELSIEARDPQFLIKKDGSVYLIDPEFFALTDVYSAKSFAEKAETELHKQFQNLKK